MGILGGKIKIPILILEAAEYSQKMYKKSIQGG